MDIGTAKPDKEEMQGIPHYGIDICDPDAYYSAGMFAKYAREKIDDIFSRKKQPIVVGGSGLYIRSLIDGVFEGNYRDENIRESLISEAEKNGLNFLYEKLVKLDSVAAEKIHPNDEKRIVRALEVIQITGKPISMLQKEQTIPASFDSLIWGLAWPRNVLYERINQRVDKMVQQGLIDEVKSLLDRGYSLKHNALDSVGYKEIIQYLEGKNNLEASIQNIKQNTRRFAKRQMTWFRKDNRIHWLIPTELTDWQLLAEELCIQHHLK